MFKLKPLFAALLLLGFMSVTPAYADTIREGMLLDTSDVSDWQVKDLGSSGDWAAQLANPAIPYGDVYQYSHSSWATDIQWVSPDSSGKGSSGYYSYMTTITDDFGTLDSDIVLNELDLKLAADNQLTAIIINGVQYDGFSPQGGFSQYIQLSISDLGNIDWNVGGSNTIEFIVHHNGNSFTGFSGSIQASYRELDNPAAVPEPATWALLLTGLGVFGIAKRRWQGTK